MKSFANERFLLYLHRTGATPAAQPKPITMNKHTLIAAAAMLLLPLLTQAQDIVYHSPAPKGEIPIMAWGSIPADRLTDANFEALKEAGINVNFSYHGFRNVADVKKLLRLSAKHGIKSIVTCPQLETNTDSVVRALKNEKGLAGYFLIDEPRVDQFDRLEKWAKRIKSVDTKHLIYLNLFPYYNYVDRSTFGGTWEDYIERFINQVSLPFVSWDIYPVTTDGIRPFWYGNLEVMRRVCERHGVPFWAFALSVPHTAGATYPMPTLEQLRLQLYTNLAYGAQGLQYFTYWCPPPYDRGCDYHEAPIDDHGVRTNGYEVTRTINLEIQMRAFVFLGCKVKAVNHLGGKIPERTTELTTLPQGVDTLQVLKGGIVVSQIENDGRRFLVLVNRSWQEPVDLRVHFSAPATLIRRDGTTAPMSLYESLTRIAPGDVAIYEVKI